MLRHETWEEKWGQNFIYLFILLFLLSKHFKSKSCTTHLCSLHMTFSHYEEMLHKKELSASQRPISHNFQTSCEDSDGQPLTALSNKSRQIWLEASQAKYFHSCYHCVAFDTFRLLMQVPLAVVLLPSPMPLSHSMSSTNFNRSNAACPQSICLYPDNWM